MDNFKKRVEEIVATKLKSDKEYPIEDVSVDLSSDEKVVIFKKMIVEKIIPMVKKTGNIIGFAGCSLNYYTNEAAEIRDPNKRIFIQILLYPKGHSKVTLGVNVPFFQLAYSPNKKNIKITQKTTIKSDEARFKIDEIEIDKLAFEKIEDDFIEFLKAALLTE